jgi:hypothetical protein
MYLRERLYETHEQSLITRHLTDDLFRPTQSQRNTFNEGAVTGSLYELRDKRRVPFNLLEYRRPLGRPYPYVELSIILNDRSKGHEPHIIWKTRKSPLWAEDSIDEFIRDLKATRGER